MISAKIGSKLDPYLFKTLKLFKLDTCKPNTLTVFGFIFSFISAIFIYYGSLKLASFFVIISGFFDMVDGANARTNGKVTKFGGFLDSLSDRYSDFFLFGSVLLYFAKQEKGLYVILTLFTILGTMAIPYARAKAEAIVGRCKVGIMERGERLILLIIGLLFNILEPIIVILCILTHVTVVQRAIYTYKKLKEEGSEI